MTKTQRWHSTRATDQPLYHEDTRCPEGGAIELKYRRPGEGGRKPCQRCTMLRFAERLKATLLPPGGGPE
jgi:hypothetical protein